MRQVRINLSKIIILTTFFSTFTTAFVPHHAIALLGTYIAIGSKFTIKSEFDSLFNWLSQGKVAQEFIQEEENKGILQKLTTQQEAELKENLLPDITYRHTSKGTSSYSCSPFRFVVLCEQEKAFQKVNSPEQLVQMKNAIIIHENAHIKHNDARRRTLFAACLMMLNYWILYVTYTKTLPAQSSKFSRKNIIISPFFCLIIGILKIINTILKNGFSHYIEMQADDAVPLKLLESHKLYFDIHDTIELDALKNDIQNIKAAFKEKAYRKLFNSLKIFIKCSAIYYFPLLFSSHPSDYFRSKRISNRLKR